MCEMCSCDSEEIGEVFPGWYLYQAQTTTRLVRAGQYVLSQGQCVEFKFSVRPSPDPLHGIPDSEVDKLKNGDPTWEAWLKWAKKLTRFEKALRGEVVASWQLVQDAIKAGYDPDKESFDSWLFHRVGVVLQNSEGHFRMFPIKGYTGTIPEPGQPGSFGVNRSHSIHTGVDLYVPDGQPIRAIETGTVIRVETFTGPEVGTPWWLPTQAVLIEGDSGVICYGEIEAFVQQGQKVKPGVILGTVVPVLPVDRGNGTTMLHLELYEKGYRGPTVTWEPEAEKPDGLLDPTPLLRGLL